MASRRKKMPIEPGPGGETTVRQETGAALDQLLGGGRPRGPEQAQVGPASGAPPALDEPTGPPCAACGEAIVGDEYGRCQRCNKPVHYAEDCVSRHDLMCMQVQQAGPLIQGNTVTGSSGAIVTVAHSPAPGAVQRMVRRPGMPDRGPGFFMAMKMDGFYCDIDTGAKYPADFVEANYDVQGDGRIASLRAIKRIVDTELGLGE